MALEFGNNNFQQRSKTVRLFVGLDIGQAAVDSLSKLVEILRPKAPELQWSPISNFHITTKFIGQWAADRIPELTQIFEEIVTPRRFEIEIAGLGFFPDAKRPRVLYAGVEAPPALSILARDTDQALSGLGIAVETRPYSPHLTLARIKTPGSFTPIRELLETKASARFGLTSATAFHLYESRPGPRGSVYTALASFPFIEREDEPER